MNVAYRKACIADIMQVTVATASPGWNLFDLEQQLARHRIGGLPVVDSGQLVGVVSRSDVVARLMAHETGAATLSHYYYEANEWGTASASSTFAQIATSYAASVESITVGDIMSTDIIAVDASMALKDAAKTMITERIHRLPVTQGALLAGVVTATDFVAAIAELRITLLVAVS